MGLGRCWAMGPGLTAGWASHRSLSLSPSSQSRFDESKSNRSHPIKCTEEEFSLSLSLVLPIKSPHLRPSVLVRKPAFGRPRLAPSHAVSFRPRTAVRRHRRRETVGRTETKRTDAAGRLVQRATSDVVNSGCRSLPCV